MTPFLEQLGQALALAGGLAGIGAMIWGAARRQRGREAVDEQTASKLATVTTSATGHASKCDETHEQTRTSVVANRERIVVLETKLEALE